MPNLDQLNKEKTERFVEVFSKESYKEEIKWKDVKDFKFEDEDVIFSGYQEPEEYSDSSHDGFYYFNVSRWVPLTQEEKDELEKRDIASKEELRKRRFEQFQKLKEEFEPEL